MENPFELIIEKLDRIEKLLLAFKKPNGEFEISEKAITEILSMNKAVEYLDLNKSTLYKYTSKRMIPHFKRGKKLYFKRSELDEWLTKRRIKTNEEIEIEAATYLVTKHKRRY